MTGNPYSILGIRESASDDEIKKAYRDQVKKYHPDQYRDNPLSDLAEKKLKEINEAYDYIMKNRQTNTTRGAGWGGSTQSNDETANSIKNHINNGNLSQAQQMLDNFKVRDASWYYLQGLLFLNKGWYDRAYTLIQRAVSMEPNNYEYRNTLNRVNNQNRSYRGTSQNRGYNNNPDICQLCTALWCADCLCGCFGGNLCC